MKKLIISTLLLLLCITTGYAQQKVYIHLNDTTIELYVWQINSITFAEDEPTVCCLCNGSGLECEMG